MIEQTKKQDEQDKIYDYLGTKNIIKIPEYFFKQQKRLKHVTSFHISWFFNDIFTNTADYKEFSFNEILTFLNTDSDTKVNNSTLKKCLKELHRLNMFIIFEFKDRWFCFPFLETNFNAYSDLISLETKNLSIENMLSMFEVNKNE